MKLILKIVAAILLIGAIAYGISWQLSKNKGTMQQEVELSRTSNTFVPVKVATVEKKSFKEDFTVNGTFQPSKEVTLVSDVSGKITKLNFDDGSYVQAGNTLLTVDNELIQNDLELSELDLEKAGKDLQRMENLLGKGGVTEVQVEEAKLRSNNLKVKIKSLKKRLSDTYVKAPISGIISQNRVENGSYLAPGTPVANIVNVSTIFLNVYLTEAQVVTARKGQKVEVTADVYQGKKFSGTVNLVDVKADESKRFRVEIAIDNPSGAMLKAGMNGKARFVAGEKVAALIIPRGFCREHQRREVYVVDGSKAVLRKVEAGETFENMVEILAGLQEGETVVLTGQINLKDRATVRVIK